MTTNILMTCDFYSHCVPHTSDHVSDEAKSIVNDYYILMTCDFYSHCVPHTSDHVSDEAKSIVNDY